MSKNHNTIVLLVDDDLDDRLFFQESFEEIKIDTTVHLLKDGKELIDHLEDPSHKLPDIIFLDLNMPILSGMECLVKIRKNPLWKDIAVAIYSTSSSETDVENSFINGANIYIKKPNNFDQLRKILSEVIMINWQYQTSGLNRDNFILNIK